MTYTPLITIVIPTYNHADFLCSALKSVIDQTYTNWEAIVIDNHSSDNTESIVLNFNNPKIKLLKTHNKGVIAVSRNVGIKEAKGEWIAFLDSDDLWYPRKLEVVVQNILQDDDSDVFSTDEMQVNITTGLKKILRHGPYTSSFYKTLLTEGNRASPSATLVSHKFLIDNRILFREAVNFVTVEDYDFWMLLARAGAKFNFIRSVQGEYTIHLKNESGQLTRHKDNLINLLKDHVFNLQNFQLNKEKLWSEVNSRLSISIFKEKLIEKDYYNSFLYLVSAFRSSARVSLKLIYIFFIKYISKK